MVVSDSEKDRDNWVRLTLRLPPELHAEIVSRAGLMSLNTTIVQLLQSALAHQAATQAEPTEPGDTHEPGGVFEKARDQSAKVIEALSDKLVDDISKAVRESLREEMRALHRKR